MNKATPPPTFRRVSWMLWGGLIVMVFFLASSFAHAWNMNQALQSEITTLSPMLTAAVETQSALVATLDYVQSDDYVAEWAREQAGMTQPGETLVIPVLPTRTPSPTPAPTFAPLPTPTPAPFWRRWWQALGGR